MISFKFAIPVYAVMLAVNPSQSSAAETHSMRMQHHVIQHQVIEHEHPMMGHCMMSASGLSVRDYRAEMKNTSRPLSMSAIEAWNRKNNSNYGGGCAMATK